MAVQQCPPVQSELLPNFEHMSHAFRSRRSIRAFKDKRIHKEVIEELLAAATFSEGSIIVYATQPGNVAEDGSGRNGTFTKALLEHIVTPDLDVKEVFDRVGADVSISTNNRQRPWISHDFYGKFAFAGELGLGEDSTEPAVPGPDNNVAKNGEMYIVTDPDGATILIDGVEKATSPVLLQELPLHRDLFIRAEKGNMSVDKTVRLENDFTQLMLELSVETGRLIVLSNENTVSVFLDGERIGDFGTGLFDRIPTGQYEIEIVGNGVYGSGQITIIKNQTATYQAELIDVGTLRYQIKRGVRAIISGNNVQKEISGTGVIEHIQIGRYTATATGYDFIDDTQTIVIRKAHEETYIPMQLGEISIRSKPSGSRVEIDGRYRGTTPLNLSNVEEGAIVVLLKHDGYLDFQQNVVIHDLRPSHKNLRIVRLSLT